MKPLQHAKISAHKHGGKWEDYIDIHEFFDQTKAHVPDMRHRAILHNAFGIFLCSQVFGEVRVNSAGREYSVRDIGEDHVIDDLGTIPTIHEVINCIDTKHLRWLGGLPRQKRVIKMSPETLAAVEKLEGDSIAELNRKLRESKPNEKCDKCGKESPNGTHPELMTHEESCPVLVEAAKDGERIAKQFNINRGPDRDMVIDGASAYRMPRRGRLID